MAVVSPSAASGGRNTGFSYVFNASRAVFQDSVQSIAAKSVIHKSKEIDDSLSTAEKCKDSVTSSVLQTDTVSDAPMVKTSLVDSIVESKNRPKSGRTSSHNIGANNVVSRTDRANTTCVNKTVADKLEDSESKLNKSQCSISQEKSSSNKRLPVSTKDAKNVRENANITGVLHESTTGLKNSKDKTTETANRKTLVQKCQLENMQHSSSKPLISRSHLTKHQLSVSKNEKSRTEFEQTVTDKTSSKHQLDCSKIDKLDEKDQTESIKGNTNEYLVKSNAETTSSCTTNIKTFDEKSKKQNLQVSLISHKSSSQKDPKDEKINRSAIDVPQKDSEQNDVSSNLTEKVRKFDKRENMQSFKNICTIEKSQTVGVNSTTNANTFTRSKRNVISDSTNKFQAENLQTDKDATREKSDIKSQKENMNKISSAKPQGDVKGETIEQTINKSKESIIKAHMDSRTDELSEKASNKCQKNIQDSVSKFSSDKVQRDNLKTKTNEKSVIKSERETTPVSQSQISVEKLPTDNKDVETCKKAVAKSQVSINEISAKKFKKDDIKNKIGSSKQFAISQKDAAESLAGISDVTSQGHDVKKEFMGKPLGSQKEITQCSTENFSIGKPQEDNLKGEKSLIKSRKTTFHDSKVKISVKKPQREDIKSETYRQSLTKSEKDITQPLANKFPVEKLQESNLITENSQESSRKNIAQIYTGKLSAEKLQKDDTKIETTKPDVSFQRNNTQICPSKISLEKLEIDELKVENSEKSAVKSQKDPTGNVMSKSAEKSRQDGIKDKREKQIAKVHKDVQNNMSKITTEENGIDHRTKAQTDKLKDKTMDKLVTKAQKDVLSSISCRSTKEQETNSGKNIIEKLQIDNVEHHPGKKTFPKSDDDIHSSASKNPSENTSKESVKKPIGEKPIVRSQNDDTEKLSSVNKIFAGKNSLKDHSGAKISCVRSQKDTIQGDTKETLSVIASSTKKDIISTDTSRTNYEANLNSKISAIKYHTDMSSHQSGANKTSQTVVEKCPTTMQINKEKIALSSKPSVSVQGCKKNNEQTTGIVSSQTCTVLDNTFINATKSADILPKSSIATHLKPEFDTAEGCTDRTFSAMPQTESVRNTFSKLDNTEKLDIIKINLENFPEKKDKLSKLQLQSCESDRSKISEVQKLGMESGIKVDEISSLNILQPRSNKSSIVGDLKTHDICSKDKDIALQDEITHPSHSASTISFINAITINNQNVKADLQPVHKDVIYATQDQSVKNRRHTKENRPCSYPSTEYKDFLDLQQRSSSQQSLDYYARDCTLSAVDYAKSRFQNVQQTPKCEEVVKPKPKHTQVVNEFKSLWENYEQKETGGLSIPHPKARKIHFRKRISSLSSDGQGDADFPIRPFLTKGSVAERVLLFECCPERALDRSSGKSKSLLYNTWKSAGLHHKTRSFYIQRDRENFELSKAAAFCRFSKSSNAIDIPLFHYPQGRPLITIEIEKQLKEIKAVFSAFTDEKVTKEEFGIITKACNLPLYWKLPLFLSAAGEDKPFLKCDVFLQYWRKIISVFHDEASQFVAVLTKCSRNYLLPDDFIPMIQDIIDTHPGLTFLKEATEFHSRYVHTVISRIYYCVNKSWSGKMTVAELRKSNFLQIVSLLEKEDDINQITDYFSYEHFYVIYCKFWELDKDHDLFIDKNDLRRHNDGAISSRMIERIFSGAVTRAPVHKDGKMSYTDFVWFLFSEEDKRHPRSIEYWFRCMDLDGDGYLSMYEMEYFYEEQLKRMEALNIETLPFKDCLCQMLDMIRPRIPGLISLTDLKKCKMTPLFFDTFFNLEKYLDHEQRDPFASQREQDTDSCDMSDWDRYAAEEYELLVAEEGSNEQPDDLIYEDYTQEDDELSSGAQKISGSSIINRSSNAMDATDEEEDYADSDLTYY